MDHTPFDKTDLSEMTVEAKRRWGGTEEYKEFERRDAGKNGEKRGEDAEGLMAIFAKLGKLKELSPEEPSVRDAVRELQAYISEHYYNCSDRVLAGLGMMYAKDERFKANIDDAGGEGTAEFAAIAIKAYCSEKQRSRI